MLPDLRQSVIASAYIRWRAVSADRRRELYTESLRRARYDVKKYPHARHAERRIVNGSARVPRAVSALGRG